MICNIPTEVVHMITRLCPLSTVSSLALTCRQLHNICNPILYRHDTKHNGSYAVFYALRLCKEEETALGTLRQAAALGSADFRVCRNMHEPTRLASLDTYTVMYSPLHMAARRGLDRVVEFLLAQKVPPDGPFDRQERTPLFEAADNRNESTAILLAQNGASLDSEVPGFDAFHVAIQKGLPEFTKYLVTTKRADPNARLKSNFTPLSLAVYHRATAMVPLLVHLGADAYGLLLGYCREQSFALALRFLGSAFTTLAQTLVLEQCLDLARLVGNMKVCVSKREPQRSLLEALLQMVQLTRPREIGTASAARVVQSFMDDLLARALSVDRGTCDNIPLYLRRGAKLQDSTLWELVRVLDSSAFKTNTLDTLKKHPNLLRSLEFAYFYCLDRDSPKPTSTPYFMSRIPNDALGLLYSLSGNALPLTARGYETLCKKKSP